MATAYLAPTHPSALGHFNIYQARLIRLGILSSHHLLGRACITDHEHQLSDRSRVLFSHLSPTPVLGTEPKAFGLGNISRPFYILSWDRVSPNCPGKTWTCSSPALASQSAGIQAYATILCLMFLHSFPSCYPVPFFCGEHEVSIQTLWYKREGRFGVLKVGILNPSFRLGSILGPGSGVWWPVLLGNQERSP